MALSDWIFIGATGLFLHAAAKREEERREEEEREERKKEKKLEKQWRKEAEIKMKRRNTICSFDEGVTEEEFNNMIYYAARKIKRITNVSIEGLTVACEVHSQSGLSSWNFSVDFNDWGKITDQYWIQTDNYTSLIPEHFAQLVVNSYKRKKSICE